MKIPMHTRLEEDLKYRLKKLALDSRQSLEDLMDEAATDVLAKYGKEADLDSTD